MEEMNRTPAPAGPLPTPAVPADAAPPEPDCWADLAPGALARDPQALLAAWMAGRAMPRRTRVRQLIGAIALAALVAGFIGSLRAILDQEATSPLQFFWPFVFYLLFMAALKDFPLLFLLRRALRRMQDGTLYPDRLHLVTPDGEEDLPLTDLIMVKRFKGWTVLLWGSWKHPQIVPIPDDACFGKASLLYTRLQELVTDIPFFSSTRPPRRRRHLVAGLLVLYVLLFTEVALWTGLTGSQSYTPDSPAADSAADPVRPEKDPTVSGGSEADLAYPSTGDSQAENPAAPQFDDTLDVCVNEDGVFFTWDGGVGSSQVLTAEDCARGGITSEADLEPLVLRWDVASFLTVEEGRVCSYTSTDQGGTWQRSQLATLGSDTLTDRCYGFAGTGQGYAALNGTDVNGAVWVKLYRTLDHGASWDRFPTPKAADGVLRPINGLCFYDAGTAVATAPGDDGSPWPYVFATADDGASWVEPDVPFAASGQTGVHRLTDLYFSDTGDWLVTFTQAPEGTRELVYETSDLTHAPWTLCAIHDIS